VERKVSETGGRKLSGGVRSFVVRDALGRHWVRWQGVTEDYSLPGIVVRRCAHQHRKAVFAERCAAKMLEAAK
jgi:hypothetical protein